MKRITSTMAYATMLSAAVLAAPSSAGDFSRGSGEMPRGAVDVEPSLRDAKPMELPQIAPAEASRALPLDEASVVKSLTARGVTAAGRNLVVEPSEALRDAVRKELSGGPPGSGGGKTSVRLRAGEPALASDRTVFGDDDRVEITNTEEFPFRAVGQLLMTWQSGATAICSGALISSHTVLTAAHCLYNHDDGGWAANIKYVPGRRGSTDSDAPYGAFEWETAYILSGYTDNYDGTYGSVYPWDLGVLILKEPIGDSLGWLGYRHYEDLGAFTANIAGYPSDMPLGTMWLVSCEVLAENIGTQYFLTDCDTYPGSSGSAVYALGDDDERIIVGVNVAGSDSANTAVRLNAAYLEWVDNLLQ
jgi:V8-like Glu-specific endopeptidase